MAKIMISIPDDLLTLIDEEVARVGMTRSGYLQELAWQDLGFPSAATIDEALRRGRAAAAELEPFDSTEAVRRSRDERDARDRRR